MGRTCDLWYALLLWLLLQLLTIDPQERTSNVENLSAQAYLSDVNMDAVLKRQVKPDFIPPVSSSYAAFDI